MIDEDSHTADRFTLAVAQFSPVFLDTAASLDKACLAIAEAGRSSVDVLAFGESWLPGYPFFVGDPADPLWLECAATYLANAIEIPGPETERLCAAARASDLDLVIGVAELDPRTRGSVYCTLLFIGREGVVLGKHRKLKPTHNERTIWADGDASGLTVYRRAYGRLSGLNCWEHNMVLPGYVLMEAGTQVHVAAWPGGVVHRQAILSPAFASSAAAYVLCAAGTGTVEDVPARYRPLFHQPQLGESTIIDPFGQVIAGPLEGEGLLIATGSARTIRAAKAYLDVGGHYSRPDVFQVTVNRAIPQRVIARSPEPANGEPGPSRS